jgi:hypothetical protein
MGIYMISYGDIMWEYQRDIEKNEATTCDSCGLHHPGVLP